MKKLAIIGASYLQLPLISKAKELGIETHVFAWKDGAVGENVADFFYPISITEKEVILDKCKEIGIDGICTIASDLAVLTVSYIAEKLNLVGNSVESAIVSTNKHEMRKRFDLKLVPSPKSRLVKRGERIEISDEEFPVIVKPLDRSGSRGITKVDSLKKLQCAIECAMSQGFEKAALVEDYVDGKEYSVECLSYKGKHCMLNITEKFTTGSPHYIEKAHIEPADLSLEKMNEIKEIVFDALNSLDIQYGASHSEIKINSKGIFIIEIGARMGGDYIGSALVQLTTGFDYVKSVIEIALGEDYLKIIDEIKNDYKNINRCAGIRYLFGKEDLDALNNAKNNTGDKIKIENIEYENLTNDKANDSSERGGFFVISASSRKELIKYMPMEHSC